MKGKIPAVYPNECKRMGAENREAVDEILKGIKGLT
jgi:hypothetical protein